jgi:LEA14-like dessication related protein
MKRIFVMAIVVITSACASVGRQAFQDPIVSFKDLRLEGVGLTGGTLDIVLGIYNPNGYRLDASRLTYRLMVDTTAVAEGVDDQPFTVRSGDSSIVRLPVTLNYSGLSEAGRALLGKGSVNYRVVGDVTMATPVGNFTRPYSQTGRFTTFGGSKR